MRLDDEEVISLEFPAVGNDDEVVKTKVVDRESQTPDGVSRASRAVTRHARDTRKLVTLRATYWY